LSKSFRKPTFFVTLNKDPAKGKKFTTRKLRAMEKQKENMALNSIEFDDFFLQDLRDRNRGYGGSTSRDRGWDYFGDGKIKPAHLQKSDFSDPTIWRKLITK